MRKRAGKRDSNTTNVKVKPDIIGIAKRKAQNSNTTNVKVKLG